MKPVEAIDAYLDHDLFQGLIESTNTKIRLLTRIAVGSTASTPTPNALARLALDSRLTPTPGPKLTHGYSRGARFVRLVGPRGDSRRLGLCGRKGFDA
jgi:hypothetical protein